GILIIFLMILGKIKLSFLLKRLLVIGSFTLVLIISLPFHKYANDEIIKMFFLTLSKRGLLISLNVIIKAIYSVMLIIFFSTITETEEIVSTFHKLGLPDFIISILSLMMRYFSLLFSEGQKLIQGRNSRFVGKSSPKELRTFGHIIGVLFLKTLDAGERVYNAMEARLGNGMVRERNLKKITLFEVIIFILCLVIIILIRLWGNLW
ncbi:cobalt ECF transporter T component CbiQ, partial [bacterium]|nr:cobalt ECF transporter T component CbiQ [bacterium]